MPPSAHSAVLVRAAFASSRGTQSARERELRSARRELAHLQELQAARATIRSLRGELGLPILAHHREMPREPQAAQEGAAVEGDDIPRAAQPAPPSRAKRRVFPPVDIYPDSCGGPGALCLALSSLDPPE